MDLPKLYSSEEIDDRVPPNEIVQTKKDERISELEKHLDKYQKARGIVYQSYPKILAKIDLIWGYPECEMELDRLVISNRDFRQGFPKEMLEAILVIHKEHQRQFGILKRLDPWDAGFLK